MKSDGFDSKAFSHVWICVVAIGIRGDETNSPEGEAKDQRGDWQHEERDQVKNVVVSPLPLVLQQA